MTRKKKEKKTNRLRWTPELHQLFVSVVEQLLSTTKRATPVLITRLMNQHLLQENPDSALLSCNQVASHLQKFKNDTKISLSKLYEQSYASNTPAAVNSDFYSNNSMTSSSTYTLSSSSARPSYSDSPLPQISQLSYPIPSFSHPSLPHFMPHTHSHPLAPSFSPLPLALSASPLSIATTQQHLNIPPH